MIVVWTTVWTVERREEDGSGIDFGGRVEKT